MQQLILNLGEINKSRGANKSLVPMPIFPLNRELTRNLRFGEKSKNKSSGDDVTLERAKDEKKL